MHQSLVAGLDHKTLLSGQNPDTDIYYSQLIQALPIAIYSCDREGYIRFYNRAAITLWGREPQIGTDLWCGSWKILDPEGNCVSLDDCPMAIALKEGRSVRGTEIVIQRPDGSTANVLPHPDPLFDVEGNIVGAVNLLVDITELKETRESNNLLKKYNEQLEQFAYAASHDMQEPLRKIRTFTSMIFADEGNHFTETGKKYFQKVEQSVERMTGVINDLLDFTRVAKEEMELEKVDLNEVLQRVKTDMELLVTEKEAEIRFNGLPVILGQTSQIYRLFSNLVHNALKFSGTEGKPIIVIESSMNGSGLCISVRDNGIGFDTRYADKIFALFQRLNDRYSFPGNGIGLTMCKKIMENHNGSIAASSRPGEGSVFQLHFPPGRVA
jgi:PAS domain S-box-containing protein